jgi:hypothetical protein
MSTRQPGAPSRGLVGNAADSEQVQRAGEIELDRAEQGDVDLVTVLSTVNGRRFYWGLLGECGIHSSVIGQHVEGTYYNAGRQDLGHKLLARVLEADPSLYLTMQQEAYLEDQKRA